MTAPKISQKRTLNNHDAPRKLLIFKVFIRCSPHPFTTSTIIRTSEWRPTPLQPPQLLEHLSGVPPLYNLHNY